MENIMVLPSKQGAIVLFAQDVQALTEGRNGETTDVYTNIFPQGITVDIPFAEFLPNFVAALNGEDMEADRCRTRNHPRRFTSHHKDGFRVPVWGPDDYIRGWLTAGKRI